MSHINSDTASPHSDGMRINEGASAEALRHVRDWLDRFVRPIATIEQRDEFDRYEYEWVETGECYEETDGDVTYTVPVLRSVSYGRDEDVQAAAEALGFDRYCDECEHVVDWLGRQDARGCVQWQPTIRNGVRPRPRLSEDPWRLGARWGCLLGDCLPIVHL